MVSEGVDIPRLRVGVYATAAKTPLIFRQIVGRFVRTIPGRAGGARAGSTCPADPVLRAHAAEVESELRHVLRRLGRGRRGLLDEPASAARPSRPRRRRSSRVAADVARRWRSSAAPGGAAGARVAGASPPADEDPPDDPALPAFERRARLRDKRHRLVADLRRLDGRTPRRDQRVAEPGDRHHAASTTRRSTSSSARSSCCSTPSAARALRPTLSAPAPPWCNG